MTLSSMTGFARVQGEHGGARWVWEIRSVNAKGFDFRAKLPVSCEAIDAEIRRMTGTVINRGTLHVSLALERAQQPFRVTINTDLLSRLATQLTELAQAQGLAPPTIGTLIGIRGVLETTEASEDSPEQEQALMDALLAGYEQALIALCAARQSEGAALCLVLKDKLCTLRALHDAADRSPARTVEAVQARLKRLMSELLGTKSDGFDPQRLHQEAVLVAMRADIREELDRLAAHLDQAEGLLAKGGAVGRRLDFLCQELGREANTLCAKAADASLTAIGLDLKTIVEQFREQVQNVE